MALFKRKQADPEAALQQLIGVRARAEEMCRSSGAAQDESPSLRSLMAEADSWLSQDDQPGGSGSENAPAPLLPDGRGQSAGTA